MKQKIIGLFSKAYTKLFRKKTHGTVWGQKFEGTSLAQPWVYGLPKSTCRENDATNPQLSHIADTQGTEATPEKSPLIKLGSLSGNEV